MKITMFAIGSTGDVRPYCILGRELKRRGHEVTIAAFSPFEEMVTQAGLNFFGIAGDVKDMMSHLMKPGAVGMSYLREAEKAEDTSLQPATFPLRVCRLTDMK